MLPSLLISIPDGIIDLGWGHPSPRLHPVDVLRRAAEIALTDGAPIPLQYGATQGYGPLLHSLAGFLSVQESYPSAVTSDQLFLTAGASQAIDHATTLFTRTGDTVFVEEPTYYLIQSIFDDHGLNVVGVPTDNNGLRMDALEAMLESPDTPSPNMLYTIPTYQNPSGSVLPAHRRRRLVELAKRHGFLVLADEVYNLLHYGNLPPPPIASFDDSDEGCALSLGSFSKILAPGLRTGWIHARPPLVQRFANAGLTISGGGLNHFTSTLVHAILEHGMLQNNIARLRRTYAERVSAMAAALCEHLGDTVEFTAPGGGYFFWLTFTDGTDTDELLPLAQEHGVNYRPGTAFSASGAFTSAIRLAFALYEPDMLVEGIRRIAAAHRESGTRAV
ncbi:MAG: PLP-dependent aminotransferase family protein [Chloroflexota bacterium]|nr:PLP-dependent aminotransferase family protein [Chloroflexota bacterium]